MEKFFQTFVRGLKFTRKFYALSIGHFLTPNSKKKKNFSPWPPSRKIPLSPAWFFNYLVFFGPFCQKFFQKIKAKLALFFGQKKWPIFQLSGFFLAPPKPDENFCQKELQKWSPKISGPSRSIFGGPFFILCWKFFPKRQNSENEKKKIKMKICPPPSLRPSRERPQIPA